MAGPYTTAIRGIRRRAEPIEVFGLALVDQPANPLVADYVLHPDSYTSCLHVAAELTEMIAGGAGPTHNDGPALTAAATAINARNSVLRIVYGDHAIILITSASHVESIEAVAGDAAHVRPLGDCLVNRADQINITHAQAVTAIGSLLSAHLGTRTAAWGRISRSAIDVFEGGRGVRNLAITIRPLTTTAAAANAMRNRIDAMKTWAHFALAAHYGRLACWECLKVHGPTAGGFFGQWHVCTACYRMYCDWCGDKLTWWSYVTRTRRCGCGQETELNAGP